MSDEADYPLAEEQEAAMFVAYWWKVHGCCPCPESIAKAEQEASGLKPDDRGAIRRLAGLPSLPAVPTEEENPGAPVNLCRTIPGAHGPHDWTGPVSGTVYRCPGADARVVNRGAN